MINSLPGKTMKKTVQTLALICIFCTITPVFGIAPVKPGVQVPQYIIDAMQNNSEKYYPRPALVYTMERYAEAKRSGLDDPEDVNGYFPVICGKYSDSGGDDWPVSQMSQQLFDGPWTTGTMREFYEEISFDEFHVNGEVYGWYQSTLSQQYVVGNSQGFGPDAHLGEFFVELLTAADPETDFGQYDNDGPDGIPNSGDDDGIVDSMFFIHDGVGGETGANNIWSHSSNLYYQLGGTYFYTNDVSASGGMIKVGPYIVQPSINSYGGMIEIGVFCHEFGHALGLPDLYDTDYTSEGIGDWGLMGGGSWNTPAKPAHMIGWCRYKMGWIDPVEVDTYLHDEPITPLELTGLSYKVWTNGVYGNQYFMVENRQRYGFDVNLHGEGLFIWHIDENAQQSNEDHPKVDLEEADGFDGLYYGINRGDGGDCYPGSSDNRWFDGNTYPNSLNYNNQLTQVAVWNISDEADTMYANLDAIYSQPLISLNDHGINDSEGNGDSRADPNETVEFWLYISNLWAGVQNLTGEMTTTSNAIDIEQSTGNFGYLPSLGSTNNQASPFRFYVHEDAIEGVWLPLSFHLTADGGYTQDLELSIMIGRGSVLLVDDDMGQNYEDFLISSLEETDYYYEVWDVMTEGLLDNQIMQYNAVIWMTGNDATNALSTWDMNNLQSYINSGKTLILTGQNINEDIGTTPFFTNYLKCSPNSNTVPAYTLAGTEGNPISDGMSLLILGGWGASNQTSQSSVIPLDIAEPLFTYPNSEIGGVHYYNPANGAHVVYLSFGLEAVSGMGATTTRTQFIESVFEWADVPLEIEKQTTTIQPEEFSFAGNYPNPFNNSTEIRFNLPEAQDLKISVFNLMGQEVAVIADGMFDRGNNSINWNAQNVSSGVYLISLKGEGLNAVHKMVLMK